MMKALIIAEPGIGAILSGKKTWEMRKRNCNIHGTIGLIRKGSGQVVGIVEINGSGPPITTIAEYTKTGRRHRTPPEHQNGAFRGGWRTPWLLRNAKRLKKPVRYKHPSGAVIWVNLAPSVSRAIEAQL